MSDYQVQWFDRLLAIPQGAWDELATPLGTPFLEWHWLHQLEASGSVSAATGWQPQHLTVWAGSQLVAAAPLYLKGHSYGEFVFDQQWADVSQRLGVRYYPKLVGMTPMTPAEGYRFLVAPGYDVAPLTALMVAEIDRFCAQYRISGCHFLYVDPQWRSTLEAQGFTPWLHHSYIWQNQGHASFTDYLQIFNANQRRNIKRERQAIGKAGIFLQPLTGDQVSAAMLSRVYDFYADTCDKFGWWGSKYLTREFFTGLHESYRERLLVMAAYGQDSPSDQPLGLSFCIRKGDRLYGRYWGSQQEIDCLHFEACYYAPIQWAIDQGIQVFDPGAGGRHKKRRGFPAVANYSMHRFYHPQLRRLLVPYLQEVNELERAEIEAINRELPFGVV